MTNAVERRDEGSRRQEAAKPDFNCVQALHTANVRWCLWSVPFVG